MKLKTLKDIELWNNEQPGWAARIVHSKELREEAIKWVKEDMDIKIFPTEPGMIKLKHLFIDRWMKRFNITEEDLK